MTQRKKSTKNTKMPALHDREVIPLMQAGAHGYEMKVIGSEAIKLLDHPWTNHINLNTHHTIDGDISITFTRHEVQKLIQAGIVSLETGITLLKLFENHEQLNALRESGDSEKEKHTTMLNFMPNNLNAIPKQAAALRDFLSLKDALPEQDIDFALFKNNLHESSFGISKVLMDQLPYLTTLLKNAKLLIPASDYSPYVVTSHLEEDGVKTIGLEHTLQLTNRTTPDENFISFIDDMLGDALKVFLSYWAYANSVGSFSFFTKMTDVMTATFDATRKSWSSVKEKRRFWELSKLLESTKLTLRFRMGKEWITIKHPMLELSITTSDTIDQEINAGYPNKIKVRVFDPAAFQQKATLATAISKSTTSLKPEDVMLAMIIQIRASQRRDYDEITYDEAYLIKQSGLERTYRSNQRMARKRLKEKLERIKTIGAISAYAQKSNIYKIKIAKPHLEDSASDTDE